MCGFIFITERFHFIAGNSATAVRVRQLRKEYGEDGLLTPFEGDGNPKPHHLLSLPAKCHFCHNLKISARISRPPVARVDWRQTWRRELEEERKEEEEKVYYKRE